MSVKNVIQCCLFVLAGTALLLAGIYFLSGRFLRRLDESSPAQTEDSFRRNRIRAKGSGYTAVSLGVLTLVWAAMLLGFPSLTAALSLVYMFFLLLAVIVLMFIFR